MSIDKKREMARRWHLEGLPHADIAKRLSVTVSRVSQLLKEPCAWERALKDDEQDDGIDLQAEYVKARTEYTKTQNIQLQRKLAVEGGTLIRRDYLEELLKCLLRHYDAQTDWLRKNRPGDNDLLDTHGAMLTATMKECERRGWVEGGNIDDIE